MRLPQGEPSLFGLEISFANPFPLLWQNPVLVDWVLACVCVWYTTPDAIVFVSGKKASEVTGKQWVSEVVKWVNKEHAD